MDKYIESAQVEKLVNRVKEVIVEASENNPNMYNKTKIKYREMASSLLDCVNLIADMLEEDLLDNSSDYVVDEFDELAVSAEEVENNKKKTEEIKNKMKEIENKIDKVDEETPVIKKDPKNKSTIAKVGKVLSELDTKKYENYETQECAKYITMWWKARFNPDIKNPNFRYQMSSIPEWIDSIVIAYGKYYHDNKMHDFDKQFKGWVKSAEKDMTNIYSTPYFIHELYISNNPNNFVDYADTIYSDLYVNGLKVLRDQVKLGFSSTSVWNKLNDIRRASDEEGDDNENE